MAAKRRSRRKASSRRSVRRHGNAASRETLTAPQRACLTYYLWLKTREGRKPKWNHDLRIERAMFDRGFLTRTWVRNEKVERIEPRDTITPEGMVALGVK